MDQRQIRANAKTVKITVKGRVQGVGFRPFVFQLAEQFNIKGTIQNNMDGVKIMAEGKETELKRFVYALSSRPPRLSRVDKVIVEDAAYVGFQSFQIIPSDRAGKSSLVIPIDSAVCDECLEEMRDRTNHRHRYPFITCTQCGPRYTIIDALPYDRAFTVMNEFSMCSRCKEEYENPLDRRHHAQPVACSDCGPKVWLSSMNGGGMIAEKDEAIKKTAQLLQDGKIIAIKGLGGYHLACDAFNMEAVKELRKRKNRPEKPLAVMAANMDEVKNICEVTDVEEHVLRSPESPIVILKKKARSAIGEELAPGMKTLGVMLPYTPLHHLLFDEKLSTVLVMTSANPSGLPILYEDEKAFSYLRGIADYILTHDRKILHPVDDSVVQMIGGEMTFIRRSRGYVPDGMAANEDVHSIVAFGSQQKNTFALGRHREIFVGPHIGDMEHIEVAEHFQKEYSHLMKWMGIGGKTIAVDLHPGYMTTRLAEEMGENIIRVQHHHAHHVSCMEDNGLKEPVFGIILDGTGFGEDGNIWGFEFLYGDASGYERLGHLRYTPLPGGEKAIKEPWRNAVGMLIGYFGEEGKKLSDELFPEKTDEIFILQKMIEKKVNSPLAGTCGRMFDAVSAILGICTAATYDGEGAMKLSEQMDENFLDRPYPYEFIFDEGEPSIVVDFGSCLREIAIDHLQKTPKEAIIARFHETIVQICVEMLSILVKRHPRFTKKVVLSGGSFHNPYLAREIKTRLQKKGFQVFTHKNVPCNDGGLSLGQLIVAARKLNGK